jgi:hypothetical protein
LVDIGKDSMYPTFSNKASLDREQSVEVKINISTVDKDDMVLLIKDNYFN